MPATYRVYIDWNQDNDFSDAREDVTGQVLDSRTPLTMQYGRDQQRALSPISPGEAHFALDNVSRDYSSENTSSPLYGLVEPGRNVQITAILAGTIYTMLRARLDDFKINPDMPDRYIDVDCIDPLGVLRGVTVSTALYRGLRPGEAAHVLLDAAGWPYELRDIDVGTTVMPWWWVDREDAFGALMDLLASEGPPALVSVDTAGRLVFRGRHHRLLNPASTTVQSTWRSSGVPPLLSPPAGYNHGWKEIINSVPVEVPQRQVDGQLTDVWTSNGRLTIADGESVDVIAQGSNPFLDAIAPVEDVDYTLATGAVTVALSRTSGASTTITVQATGGPAEVVDLKLRAYAVLTVSTVQLLVEDASSVAKYGRRSLPDAQTPKWAGLGDGTAIGNIILAQRGERLPTISVSIKGVSNTVELTQQLVRDLSDRVHVVESHTGLDSDCYIEQIAHTIQEGGLDHVTTFGLEKAPTQIPDVFILGSTTNGVLGTNRLGRRAMADPSIVFILGSATNGVLGESVLAP
jgi:hypothetical protein